MQRPLMFKLAAAAALICSMRAAIAEALPEPPQSVSPPQSARLLTALALIVPQPYEINVDNSIPTDTRVSWTTNGDWEQQMRAAADSAGLGVRFNVPARALLIFRLPRIHRVFVGADTPPPPVQTVPAVPVAAVTAATELPEAAPAARGFPSAPAHRLPPPADGWNMPAPTMHGRQAHLINAIRALIPPKLASKMELEILAANASTLVHWGMGSRLQRHSRWDALQIMLRRLDMRARINGILLVIEPISSPEIVAAPEIAAAPESVKNTDIVKSIPAFKPIAFKPIPLWTLKANEAISVGMSAWAKASGWKIVWNIPQDWLVPNTLQFQGNFRAAATEVIQDLAANGADIRADVYSANKTLVVHAAGQGG